MIVLTVFKQICCFSFDLPLLFPSRSSPCCKLAGQVMVFFMLIVLVLPLNSSQMVAEGCFTLNRSSLPFSFYFPPSCSNFSSLSSNNISPKDQVEKQFIVRVACMYMYNPHMHAYVVYMYTHTEYVFIYARICIDRVLQNSSKCSVASRCYWVTTNQPLFQNLFF